MKPRTLLILGGAVVVLVIGTIVFLQYAPISAPPTASSTPPPAGATPSATPAPLPGPKVASNARPATAGTLSPTATPPPLAAWELKIEKVLTSQANETETAQMLINLLPTLPVEGQAEAAQHITNLLVGKDYNRVLPLLRNASLPREVQDVLVTDLMNREDAIKLPALLDVAKIPNHPYHEEALTDLQIFLDQDNGGNWAQWDTAVKGYLKRQQDELGVPATAPGGPGPAQ